MNHRLQQLFAVVLVSVLVVGAVVRLRVTERGEEAQALTPWQPSVIVLWNEVMLAAIRNGAPRPTVSARSLFMVHQAMFDAWALYDATAAPTVLNAELRPPAGERS